MIIYQEVFFKDLLSDLEGMLIIYGLYSELVDF